MGDARMSSGREFQTVGASKAKLKPNCLVNFRLKLWNIKEICNTLTASSIVSIVVCGRIWSKVFREASVNKLVHQGSQFELNREPMEFPKDGSYPSKLTRICNNCSCTILDRL